MPSRTSSRRLSRRSRRLSRCQRQRSSFGLVIDEADHISSKQNILETVRDLTDNLEMPAVLVGMGKINDNLRRFPQVSSRVSQRVRFDRATKADVNSSSPIAAR